MTYALVYVSRVAPSVTGPGLLRLMATSRKANARTGITGLLLYRDGGFLQMLEGSREAVESLYASIQRDDRHSEVTLVRAREQRGREFPDWNMAFGAFDDGPLEVTTGGVEPGQTESEAAFVRDLLALFDANDHP
ncbi:MAG TPA: BLUF domain-containing protein [Friedmanniella sp.]